MKFKIMKGQCDSCTKTPTSEYLVKGKDSAWILKFCNDCKPKTNNKNLTLLYGN